MSTMDKIKAKVDNVLHKDGTSSDPTGPHNSHAANKADPRVDSDHVGAAGNTTGAGGIGGGQYTGQTGTHHTGTHHTGTHHTGTHHTGTHHTGTAGGMTGSTGYSDPSGPHDTRMANKLDPRVDSDRVGAAGNTAGAGGIGGGQYTGTGTHHTGTTGGMTGGTGLTGSTGYSDPTGPHDSRMMNKADPRVDSDRVGAAGNTAGAGGFGAGQYTEGTHTGAHTGAHTGTHTGAHHGHHGHHGHQGTAGVAGTGTSAVGSGSAPNTAGPHNSDMLNKMDPRVDSDLSGGKTYGGNATNQ